MKPPGTEVLRFLETKFEKGFRLCKLLGDASQRDYYRLYDRNENCFVVMVTEPFQASHDKFLKIQSLYEKAHIHVPMIKSYSEKTGVLVLEDLGDQDLEKTSERGDKLNLYKKALDELIKINFQVLPTLQTSFEESFDFKTFMREIDLSLEHFVLQKLGIKLESSLHRSVRQEFSDICYKLLSFPQHLCHRDYHSRNLMVSQKKVFVIDFQCSRKGPLAYDLVSLLHDPYRPLDPDLRRKLSDYFLHQARFFCDFPKENFEHQYRLQILQRCFKVCGNYASFFNIKNQTRYLPYIEPAFESFEEALKSLPSYKNIQTLSHKIREEKEKFL